MMDVLATVVGFIVAMVVGFGALAAGFIYDVLVSGFVIHKLWAWFVVATFHVAPLPILAAAGIALLIGYLTIHLRGPEEACGVKPEVTLKQKLGHLAVVLVRPWLILLLGFIITLL